MKNTTSIWLIGLLVILASPFGGAFTCPTDGMAAGIEPLGEPLRSKQGKLVFSDEFDGRKT